MKHRFRVVARAWDGAAREGCSLDDRTGERFPVWPEEVLLRTTCVARLVDESYDGIGLVVDDTAGLSVGQTIEIEDDRNAHPLECVIVHLTTMEDGRWKVGVQLDESHCPI